jgi:hypothetical protein
MNLNLTNDAYYHDDYISLYLRDEDTLFSFEYKEDNSFFINKTIKRPITKIGNIELNDGFYDLESAYGYGGFYTNSEDKSFIKRAMKEYEKKCKEENIIAEFTRFHPFNDFPLKHQDFLDFNIYDRDVVIKYLSEDILLSYNAKVRNTVKRATEKILFQESENIDIFMKLYNETMKKNEASDFYFFSKEYYENLLKNKDIKLYEIIYDSQVIAMGFFMFGGDIAHYHLSANSALSYKINANYALLHNVFNVAKKLGLNYFLLGGGATPSEEDSLFRFKKKFSKELKPFYISGKVYNRKVYDGYNKLWESQSEDDVKYFLKYRLEI